MDRGLKTALIVGGVVLGALIVLSVVWGLVWGWQGYGYGMMGPGIMGGTGTMFLMPIAGIVIIGLIVWAVVAAVQKTGGTQGPVAGQDSALELLKKRYARGEISKEEFERVKKDLT